MPLTIHKIHVTCKVVCLMAMYEQRDNNNNKNKELRRKKRFQKDMSRGNCFFNN